MLPALLFKELEPVLLDATAAPKALDIDRSSKEANDDAIFHFCVSYGREQDFDPLALKKSFEPEQKRARELDSWLYVLFDLSDNLRLIRLHKVVQFATDALCRATLLTHPVSGESLDSYSPLSPTERRRIWRSFYRYQVFCLLSTLVYPATNAQTSNPDDLQEVRMPTSCDCVDQDIRFFDSFPEQEMEEIASVRDLLIGQYDKLSERYKSQLATELYQDPRQDPFAGTSHFPLPKKALFTSHSALIDP